MHKDAYLHRPEDKKEDPITMAILKNISIHSSRGVKSCINYVEDETKNTLTEVMDEIKHEDISSDDHVGSVLKYAQNLEKTVMKLDGESSILVSGVNCFEESASDEFAESKYRYEVKGKGRRRRGSAKTATYIDKRTGQRITVKKKPIDAEHLIQSFPAEEHGVMTLDPRLVHKMGIEFAKRAFPGFQCVISTHMNTKHVHNHIVVCAYAMDGTKKICMNKALRHKLRRLNDEISLAYDLPVLIDIDIDNKNHSPEALNFREDMIRSKNESGMSSKDIVKRDIDNALKTCRQRGIDDWNGFISIMEEVFKDPARHRRGYMIQQTAKHVYFTNLDLRVKGSASPFKVRDTVLGDKYMRKAICRRMGWEEYRSKDENGNTIYEEQLLQDDKAAQIQKKRDEIDYVLGYKRSGIPFFNISRYDENGRRRSDLEMVFLAAIKLLIHFKDRLFGKKQSIYGRFLDRKDLRSDPMKLSIDKKIQLMERAMHTARVLGINSVQELKEKKTELGQSVNLAKQDIERIERSVKHYQDIEDIIMGLRLVEGLLKKQGKDKELTDIEAMLSHPDKDTIRSEHAALEPLTKKQRRDIYNVLQENSMKWRLKCKYTELTSAEAYQVIRFLKHKTDIRPDVLISYEEYKKNRDERHLNLMFERWDTSLSDNYGSAPPSSELIRKVSSVLLKNGIDVDTSTLSKYDCLQIINHFSKNAYTGTLISDSHKKDLQRRLLERGLSLNRNIDFVFEHEYESVIAYLDGKGNTPDLLKEASLPSNTSVSDLMLLLEKHGENIDIPIDSLSRYDVDNMLRHLLYKDHVPEVLTEHAVISEQAVGKTSMSEEEQIKAFNDILLSVDMETARLFIQYRELKRKALNLGLSDDNYDDYMCQLDMLEEMLKVESLSFRSLADQYKNISVLERNVGLANDLSFTQRPYISQLTAPEPNIDTKRDIPNQVEIASTQKESDRSEPVISSGDLFDDTRH